MNRTTTTLGGLAAGATLMFFLDPDRGRRRRALAGDKAESVLTDTEKMAQRAARDARNRARGLLYRARSAISREQVSDDVLNARVRSRLGAIVARPATVEVSTDNNGTVTLSGSIADLDALDLIESTLYSVPGVKRVINRLDTSSAEQGVGAERLMRHYAGSAFGEYWSPSTRVVLGSTGGFMAVSGLRRGSFAGAMLSGLGIAMIARSIFNQPLARVVGLRRDEGLILVNKTIEINAPVEEVFEFFHNFDNLPRVMSHLREVRDLGDGRSRWVANGPANLPLWWECALGRFVPNESISWRSTPDSMVRTSGAIRFQRADDNRSRIDVHLSYSPPAGALGHAFAVLFGADPKSALDDDLVRLKSLFETGKTTTKGETITKSDVGGSTPR